MFNSLNSFYTGDVWKATRQSVIMDRLNDKGQSICECCGKPILQGFDLVIHHKIELNIGNVNDYDISLNPSNLMILHRRCHDEVHNRMGFTQRKVILVWGSSCSGKTTYVHEAMGLNDIVLDIDSIWQCITNNPRYIKPNGTWEVVRALRDELKQQIKMRAGQWHNAYIITSEARKMARDRMADEVGADEVIYIEATKEQCIERLYADTTRIDKQVHLKYIEQFYNRLQT